MLTEWKRIKNVVFLLIIIIMSIIILTLLVFPDHEVDLLLNLFSETIGTAISIFGIDRLLKMRDENHQMPTRYLWYTKLFDLVEELLSSILPDQYYQPSNKIYYNERTNLYVVPRLENLHVSEFEELVSQITKALEEKNYHSFLAQLFKSKEKINTLIERSSSYFQESEMILILGFERSLERFQEIQFDLNDNSSRRDIAVALSIVIKHAVKIDLWLRGVIESNFTRTDSRDKQFR
jgi:hypothetical protein